MAFSGNAETAYETYTSTVSDCYKSQLAMATPQNIKQLKTYISSLSHGGGTYYANALTKAFQLFIDTDTVADESNRSECIFVPLTFVICERCNFLSMIDK